jgi:hypothetical protein
MGVSPIGMSAHFGGVGFVAGAFVLGGFEVVGF